LEGIEEPSERHTADSPLLQGEQRAALENAIQQLPPSEQRLIRMKGDDLNIDEISEQTGIPKRSVSAMLSTARKRLMNILNRSTDD
jgi:RNA polymerase sigma factor (sigma-70 family)